jgi:hypothetical protein
LKIRYKDARIVVKKMERIPLRNGLEFVDFCLQRLAMPNVRTMGRASISAAAGLLAIFTMAAAGLNAETFSLVVPEGAPLEISIDRRIAVRRVGEPVEAHLVRSVYAFNSEVIPAGSQLTGRVVRLDPVPLSRRIRSMMSGDFTPLRDPKAIFEKLYFPDGRVLRIETRPASLTGRVVRPDTFVSPEPKDSFTAKTVEFVRTGLLNAREEVVNTWKSDDKWDRLQQAGYSYLPYHPQFIPKRTQVAVELEEPLTFGTVRIDSIHGDSAMLPPVDSIVNARMISTVTSTSEPGTRVEAIVSEPLYADDQLLLPEGTRLIGTVVDSQAAASWRRGGKVRFSFQWMELPPGVKSSRRMYHLQAILAGVDTERISNIKVDQEGGSESVESVTRFFAPALKALIGTQVFDDTQQSPGQGQGGNRTWRTLAGASGFGVVGSVASQISRDAGTGLGFYGLGWSVFTHIVARGRNVVFMPDTPVRLRLVSAAT